MRRIGQRPIVGAAGVGYCQGGGLRTVESGEGPGRCLRPVEEEGLFEPTWTQERAGTGDKAKMKRAFSLSEMSEALTEDGPMQTMRRSK